MGHLGNSGTPGYTRIQHAQSNLFLIILPIPPEQLATVWDRVPIWG